MHIDDGERSTKERSLENYTDSMDKVEEAGGFVWACKSIVSGSLQETEGIWLSSRLLAAIAIMLSTTIIVLLYSCVHFKDGVDLFLANWDDLAVNTDDDVSVAGDSLVPERWM